MRYKVTIEKNNILNEARRNYVYLSENIANELNVSDVPTEFRKNIIEIEYRGLRVWLVGVKKEDLNRDEINIPLFAAENLGVDVKNSDKIVLELSLRKFEIEDENIINEIKIEKIYPKDIGLSKYRKLIEGLVENRNFGFMINHIFYIGIRLKSAKKDIWVKFLVAEINGKKDSSNKPFFMPYMAGKKFSPQVKISNLGVSEEEIGFELIGGLDEEIKKVRELVEIPFEYPEVYSKIGVKPAKGILLYGPPGTGKTLIARAVAYTTKAKFIKLNAAELFSEFAGKAEEKLRNIFQEASEAERAIIFIDEIDALAVKRETAQEDFTRRLVGQFLPLMDGLENDGRVVVMAATNRINAIDPAFRRPGRFDREVYIGIPNEKGREEILKIHTSKMSIDSNVDIKKIAELTHGYVGADLEALCREAGLKALNRIFKWEGKKLSIKNEKVSDVVVKMEDFLAAIDEFIPSTLRNIKSKIPKVDWYNDIIGLEEVKQVLYESIAIPLKKPEVLTNLNISSSNETLIIGPKGSGRKTVVYALANMLGIQCLTLDVLRMLFNEANNIEDFFQKVIDIAEASSPVIIVFPDLDDDLKVMESEGLKGRFVYGFEEYFDKVAEMKHVYTVVSTKNIDDIPESFFKFGRFDQVVEVKELTPYQKKCLLKNKFNDVANDEQYDEFVKKNYKLSGGELIYKFKRLILNALSKGYNNLKELNNSEYKTLLNSLR